MIKYSTILIIASLLGCKATDKERTFIPRNFSYPIYQPGKGKLYIYQNIDSPAQLAFEELKLINESNELYFIAKHYSSSTKFDSIKVDLSGNVREFYNFNFDTSGHEIKIKGNIVKGQISDDRKTYSIKLNLGSNILTIDADEKYIKDSLFKWNKREIPCIVTEKKIKIINQSSSLDSEILDAKIITLYGKDIGVIKYSTEIKNKITSYELIRIDYQ